MRQVILSTFLILLLSLLNEASGTFFIKDRFPPKQTGDGIIYIKRSKSITLSCSSNEEFNLCQWVRPGSLSCGILNSEKRKTCPQDERIIGMSNWKIEKENVNKCSLTIESVNEADEGKWHCKLQSLPNNNADKYDLSLIHISEPTRPY